METQEQHEEQKTVVTPPPFRPNEEPQEPLQEPSVSPTLADRLNAMGLDENTTKRLTELTAGLNADAVSADLLTTLAQGLTHDDDVQNADAEGYLRGRNERIEAVLHPQTDDDAETQASPVFPRYCRRSIWD